VALKRLDLSCNNIGFQGICNLLAGTKSKLKNLEQLELFNCGISPDGFDKKIKHSTLKSLHNIRMARLQQLNLSYNNVGTNMLSILLDP